MKTISLIALFSLAAFSLVYGQKKKVNAKILHKHDVRVQKIMKTDDGMIRGYKLGATKADILKTETAKLDAQTEHALIYKVDVGNGEYADIIYMMDENQKVKGVSVAFVIQNKAQENSLLKDMTAYYVERYGDYFTDKEGDEFWVAKDGYRIEMSDSSSDGFVEIEIEYSKN